MKLAFALALLSFSLILQAKDSIKLFVKITPSGSFEAVSDKIKGKLIKENGSFIAENVYVPIKSITTENSLRDSHLWKHLNGDKYDKVILTGLKGKDGKATAELSINGVTRPISITYTEGANDVDAKFTINATDFNLPKVRYLDVGVEDVIEAVVKMSFKTKPVTSKSSESN